MDAAYARKCLDAATRCWRAWKRGGGTLERSWNTMAAIEMYRATGEDDYAAAATEAGGLLLALQNTEFTGSQKEVRGFWRTSESDANPFCDAVHPAVPRARAAGTRRGFPAAPRRGAMARRG